ncbi:MAG: response regulator [Anaerolineales bacterium]|nr:response regulator [Anaerolineales bacterium]
MISETLILVADDNQEIRDFLEEALETLGGYSVHSVGDGLSALTLVHELQPDLLITDQQMPNLSGIELIHRVRADYPALPVILMTGESSEALAVDALRVGATDYLVKPFDPDELLETVDQSLELAQKLRTSILQAMSGIEGEDEEDQQPGTMPDHLESAASVLFDLDEVLSGAVDTAVRLTGAEEGSLLLLDEVSGELHMRASKNFDDEFASTFRVHVEDSLAGQVISHGEPIILDENAPQKIKTSYLVHSLLYVPLKVRGKVIGVLGIDNRTPGKTLNDEDRAILMAMADYAALAIENAQLYIRSDNERLQLETILREVQNSVVVIDMDHRIIMMNQSAQEIIETEADPVGMNVEDVFKDPKLLALVMDSGENPEREELELGDGRVFGAVRTPIAGVGQAIVMQDISHLKELDRIKSEFVTAVSHDLRSPLTAILGYIELVQRAGPVNDNQRDFIQRVQTSVVQISDLISDLLDLSRIEAGLDTTKVVTDISKIIRDSVKGAEHYAQAEGIHLEMNIPEDLGFVYGDPIRLRQMIGNLLENGVKYSYGEGVVSVEAETEDDQVIIRVQDYGTGIPRADQPKIFDRFFRASNVPEELPGTGLGLSIVKSILDNHYGRIWLESTHGEGTTFTVVLPLHIPEDPQ